MHKQLDLFKDSLPYKPYCSDELSWGLTIRPAMQAIEKRYIQHNQPTKKLWFVHDVDRPTASIDWQDFNIAGPNITAMNPDNGHAHLFYSLDVPVVTGSYGRMKPLRYAGAVEYTYAKILDADMGYSGLISKNPHHPHWDVKIWNDRSYDLYELADYVNLESFKDKRKRLPDYGLGRNVNLFDKTRQWAYKTVRTNDWNYIEWSEAVFNKADIYNSDFRKPLPLSEVNSTAKSISKWTWRNMDFQQYVKKTHTSEIQRIRGIKGNIKSVEARRSAAETKKEKVLEMKSLFSDSTLEELSNLTQIPYGTIRRLLRN